jgi:hypothetical protein
MRILFDHGTPVPLRALLKAAEAEFDVLITTDRNLRHQQNTTKLRLAILILPTTSWPKIRTYESRVLDAVNALRPGDIVELNFS